MLSASAIYEEFSKRNVNNVQTNCSSNMMLDKHRLGLLLEKS